MSSKQSVPAELPASFLPLLAASGMFKVREERGRIILEPSKAAAKALKLAPMAPQQAPAAAKGTAAVRGKATPAMAQKNAPEPAAQPDRARLKYFPVDKRHTPDVAKTYGLSPTRLKVYKVIFRNAKRGLLARDIMAKTELPHGSIQQTLNWLRSQRLVKGAPIAA